MANGDSLSKIYTLEKATNRALSRLGISDPEGTEAGNLIYKLIQEINVKHQTIAKTIRDEDEKVKSLYEQTASLTFTGGECTFTGIEVGNPLIVEPLRLNAYRGNEFCGEVPFLPPSAFSNLSGFPFYDNSLIHTTSGRRILLYAGKNLDVTVYNFKLVYTREVNTLVLRGDYLDIPNTSFDDLVNELILLFQPKPKETQESE